MGLRDTSTKRREEFNIVLRNADRFFINKAEDANTAYDSFLEIRIFLLYKARFHVPSKALLLFYYTLGYPYLTYCNLVWDSTYPTNLLVAESTCYRNIEGKELSEIAKPWISVG